MARLFLIAAARFGEVWASRQFDKFDKFDKFVT